MARLSSLTGFSYIHRLVLEAVCEAATITFELVFGYSKVILIRLPHTLK